MAAACGFFGGVWGIHGAPEKSLLALREAEEAHNEERTHLNARLKEKNDEIGRAARELRGCKQVLQGQLGTMSSALGEQMAALTQGTETLKDITNTQQLLSELHGKLTTNAEMSSSSILEMMVIQNEVADNISKLAGSVGETVSSIQEMSYSINEVARNIDALALTAEETSSSMNEMDVSIDQVQSNANETARLSEEVAEDAEKGAEAILNTITEINRIRETFAEAVSVISNLGTRIEAIGEILNVIDEVAEQTNLLALNAAIIAAQAGEHGKGFAVVADEIKDLAERAGTSTKEIAELIKTIQTESKNAIGAVERGATTVDRGVQVSAKAEETLKKILDSSRKSTSMVRAIARATVEQSKGSKASHRCDRTHCTDGAADRERDCSAGPRLRAHHEKRGGHALRDPAC